SWPIRAIARPRSSRRATCWRRASSARPRSAVCGCPPTSASPGSTASPSTASHPTSSPPSCSPLPRRAGRRGRQWRRCWRGGMPRASASPAPSGPVARPRRRRRAGRLHPYPPPAATPGRRAPEEPPMLILLAAFAGVPLVLPWLVHRIGTRAFHVAAALSAIAFVHTLVLTPAVLSGATPFETFAWIPELGIELSMRMDTLSWLLTLIVTGVGALVMLYCRWYFHRKDEGLGQFSAVLLAFAGAMYGLVLTDDLVVLVMFWEVTSILSYLLIGYYHRRGASRRAALQALLVTTIGGLVMLIGVVLLVVEAGTSSLSGILALAPQGPAVDTALVLILVGALSKSAIFPFHFWLPGAMAAPTPVSAYLHAA